MDEKEQRPMRKRTSNATLKEIQDELHAQSAKLAILETQLEKIRKMLVVGKVVSALKFVLFIVLPIALSIIYLPPLLETFIGQYEAALNQYQGIQVQLDDLPFIK